MWCIRVDEYGQFRCATGGDVDALVFSLADWHKLDPAAAEQFDPLIRVQRQFMRVTGLEHRAAVNASLANA